MSLIDGTNWPALLSASSPRLTVSESPAVAGNDHMSTSPRRMVP
jgi:hypothetical protein